MSTTTTVATNNNFAGSVTERRAGSNRADTQRHRVWTVGLGAGVAAAAATSLSVVVTRAFGGDVVVDGAQIPVSGFAMLTLIGAVFGVAIAKLAQRARRPRARFVGVTVALTGMSIIPDLVVDATRGSRLVLAACHMIAAVIIVPAIAHRLEP